MEKSLESILERGKDIKEQLIRGAKSYAADSLTGIVFYTPLMFAYETLARGYSIGESLEIRGKAAVLGLALYGTYGQFRKLCAHATKTTKESSSKRKAIVETASSYIFNVSVYAGILMQSGADSLDATATALAGTVLVSLTGRPYGWVLDRVRRKFNLPATYG